MNITFDTIISVTILLGFFYGILRYIISNFLTPLQITLNGLNVAIKKVNECIEEIRNQQQTVQSKVILLEQKFDTLHEMQTNTDYRLDTTIRWLYQQNHEMSQEFFNDMATPNKKGNV